MTTRTTEADMHRNNRHILLLIAAIVVIAWAMTQIPTARAQTMMPPGTPATPGTACGAEGVGRAPGGAVVKMALPGNRVDDRGNWTACDRPCIGDSKPREWTVNGNACTTATPRGYSGVDDPRLNRALRHDTYGSWRATDQRGLLIERCMDGERTVVYSSCSPPPVVTVAPPAPPPVASAPDTVVEPGCGQQTLRRNGLTAVYSGPRVTEGGSVVLRLGLRHVPAWCRNGKLTFEAPTLSAEQAASAADEWRRGVR